jgi:malonyl-CoA O-methyltransferase
LPELKQEINPHIGLESAKRHNMRILPGVEITMESNLHICSSVRRTFDRVASRYDEHAALEQEVAARLLERLEFARFSPQRIVDLGCGTGQACVDLKNRFRKAEVIGLDSSRGMLMQLRQRPGEHDSHRAICADMSALPLADRSSDLLFSNLAMLWCPDPIAVFTELRRVLAPGGMLLFSSFGPGTFRELNAVGSEADGIAQSEDFADILQLGDALMAAGFNQPVMDTERITVSYPDIDTLVGELDATGSISLLQAGNNLVAAKIRLEDACETFKVEGRYPVSYEVIYGAAFGPDEGQPRRTPQGDVVTFSVESLRETGRNRR